MTTERPTRARSVGAACGLCLGLLLAGCPTGATSSVNSSLEAEIPSELRADYKSFTQNCAKCHGLERALNAHVTDVRHWDLYVAKMMRTAGSAISKSESPKILRFLYWYTTRENERADSGQNAAKYTLPPLKESDVSPPAAPAVAPTSQPVQAPVPASDVGPGPATTPRSESIQGDTAP